MSSAEQSIKARKRSVKTVNPIAEAVKMVLGGGFGLFMAVMVLSYFWGIDLLGWRKQPVESVASAGPQPEPSGIDRLMSERGKRPPVVTPAPPDRSAPNPDPASEPERQAPVVAPAEPVVEPAAQPAPDTTPPDQSGGATLTVAMMQATPITSNNVPEFLRGGTVFTWINPPKSVDVALGETTFAVERSGIVVLGESWKSQGGGGDWTATRLTREQLVQKGWEPCGTVTWPPDEPQTIELFRKVCRAGEHYTIRTNKYWPPVIFSPPAR